MNIEQIRTLFESMFTPPESCTWCGKSYAPTSYNAWDADKYCQKFEGFRAAIEWMDRNKYKVATQTIGPDEASSLLEKWNSAVMHSHKTCEIINTANSEQEYLDRIAACWLTGLASDPNLNWLADKTAKASYDMADAMLAEKKKRYK